jgi:signal transduction histidine kinase/FixJ family two-component response regulator
MAVPMLFDPAPRLTGDLFERALAWRAGRVWQRGAQGLVVASLTWFATHDPLTWAWLAAAIIASAIDGRVSSHFLWARGSRARLAAPTLSHAVSAAVFSSGALILLASGSPLMASGAVILLCAVCLNNAMMSYGSRLATAALVGPAAAMLVLAPFLAIAFGHPAPIFEAALLSAGALGFTVFIVRLAWSLSREEQGFKDTLQALARQTAAARAAEQATEERRRRWALIFDQSPLARVVFDASRLHEVLRRRADEDGLTLGQALSAQFPTFAALQAYTDPLERNDAALALSVGAADAARFEDGFLVALGKVIDQMSPDGEVPPFEATLRRPDGSIAHVEAHLRVTSSEGRPWSLCLATYVDVTASTHAARKERRAREAAELASRAKGEFLAMMNHEMRTPLNGVLGMAQAMAAHPLSRGQRARLDVIRQSGAALLEVMNDVLDLGRLEEGALLEPKDVDLADLLESLRAAYAPSAAARGLSLEVAITPQARGLCSVDPARLRQLVGALVSNALKFTHQGGVRIDIDGGSAGVVIEVVDTGIGIAPDRIARLFDPFEQADSSSTRRYGGAGLGLALCRRLCVVMGGAISVESTPGQGSLFRVALPLSPRSCTAAQDGVERPIGRARVLAAEDNPVNQAVLKALLETLDVELTVVETGLEAVKAWVDGAFDLVLMDVRMPEMDGPTATRRIRELEAQLNRPRTPVIAVTANAHPSQRDGYLACGMDGVVAKPIELAELVAAMSAALEGAGADGAASPQISASLWTSSPRR